MAGIAEAVESGRRAIRQREIAITEELLSAYGQAWRSAERELRTYADTIQAAIEAGVEIDEAWLRGQTWYRQLQVSVEGEFSRFERTAQSVLGSAQGEAVALASGVGERVRATIGDPFAGRVRPGTMERWISATQPGSPLQGVLARYGPRVEGVILQQITEGIGTRQGSSTIIRRIVSEVGTEASEWRVATLVRTESMRSYRGAFRDDMQALGQDVIHEWEWLATKSPRTCGACLALDGTRYPYDNYPDQFHVACRCVIRAVPHPHLVPPTGRPRETGEQWLRRQPVDVQRRALRSEAAYELFRDGEPLMSFVGVRHSETWGSSVYLKPARDVGGLRRAV